jgi:hypothetical protein
MAYSKDSLKAVATKNIIKYICQICARYCSGLFTVVTDIVKHLKCGEQNEVMDDVPLEFVKVTTVFFILFLICQMERIVVLES